MAEREREQFVMYIRPCPPPFHLLLLTQTHTIMVKYSLSDTHNPILDDAIFGQTQIKTIRESKAVAFKPWKALYHYYHYIASIIYISIKYFKMLRVIYVYSSIPINNMCSTFVLR